MTESFEKNPLTTGLGRLQKDLRHRRFPLPKILIFLILTLLLTLLFPHGERGEATRAVGTVWVDKDLIATFPFPIVKDPQVYQSELAGAEGMVPPVFRQRENAFAESLDSLHRVWEGITAVVAAYDAPGGGAGAADGRAWPGQVPGVPFQLSPQGWEYLYRIHTGGKGGLKVFLESSGPAITAILREVYSAGVLDSAQVKQRHPSIAIRTGNREEIVSVGRVYSLAEARSLIGSQLAPVAGQAGSDVILKSAQAVLLPSLLFDQGGTDGLLQAARDNVPRTVGFVQENERIVSKHEKITPETKLKLDSFMKARAERALDSNEWRYWAGTAMHVAVILSLFGIYIVLFRRPIYRDNTKLVLIGLIILMEAGFAYLTVRVEIRQPVQYLIFVPAASMLLTIIFDSRIGFYGTVIIAFIVAGIRGNDYSIALVSLIAGGLGAYTVRDIRNRTQIFRSLVFIFFGYFLSIVALGLEQFEPFDAIATQLSFAFANSVFSPVITYGLLIFFEKAFRVTTDLTLLELSDFNHPLLRKLSERAPGTFHHSMLLGNLSEAAAESIGANPILARVGAYYHDIGKMNKPEYFVENQKGVQNKHVRLRPRMSALILASHVKEGADLGREHRLPEKIVDFIYQHHGTNRISFFYDKAVKQAAKKREADAVREEDFRYPGPKPQSKEAGIVMLADSVEASMRAVDHLSPGRMEEHIGEMIRTRFLEGQLDQCELTLKDLTKIKEAFLKILVGIHHQRIKYPVEEGADAREGAGQTREPAPADPAPGGSGRPIPTPYQEDAVTGAPLGEEEEASRGAVDDADEGAHR
ncbi:MAG TPA: HDIG domain-containing protein [Bacteroidota bacterium]|nr:HDIG domain-containing protein [Bacteroidota bacterium]